MKPDRWPEIERLYDQALALSVDDRSAFLDTACAGDDALRREVESLFSLETAATDFLEQPAIRAAATTLSRALPHLLPPEVPGCHIIRELGEGGMGVVYLAEQREPLQRVVALKLIRPGMDTRQVHARFERERQALARMDHPNIAAVFDAGYTADLRPYFVMEFVDGVSITEYCDSRQLSVRARLSLFIQVCNAVQHAHQKGIIHRDLKPSNVLVIDQDGQPVPKIIDFGTAKSADRAGAEATPTDGLVFGTVEYMSPEQAAFSSDIDTTTDVYSLGVLLYELLIGRTPFDRHKPETIGLEAVLKAIRNSDPPRPSTLVTRDKDFLASVSARGTDIGVLTRQLAGDLDWIVLKALEKDRRRRYQTAASLGADVQRFQDSRPIEARPPSAAYRVRKFTRRYRGAVAATVVVALTLILGLVTSTRLYLRSEANRKEADLQKSRAESGERAAFAALAEMAHSSYVATIAFADTEVRSAKLASLVSARERLTAIPPSQRNWEWWYLFNQTDDRVLKVVSTKPAMPPCGFPGPTTEGWQSIVLDAASRKIALRRCDWIETWSTSGTNSTVFSTRYRILALNPDTKTLVGIPFTLPKDSRWTVVFFNRWTNDATSSVELGKFEDIPECADIARDGQRVAIGFRSRERVSLNQSRSHVFEVWSAKDGRLSRFVPSIVDRTDPSPSRNCQVRFSPDGKLVASSATTIDVWNAASGAGVLKDDGRPGRLAQPIAFNQSAERLAIGRANGSIDVLQVADAGAVPVRLSDSQPAQPAQAIAALAFSPDGLTLASGAGKTVTFWDLAQRTKANRVGHDADVIGLVISADGRFVYSADVAGQIRGWPVQRPAVVMQPVLPVRGNPTLFSDSAMALQTEILRLPDLQRINIGPDDVSDLRVLATRRLALSADGSRLYIAEQAGKGIRLRVRSEGSTHQLDQPFAGDNSKCAGNQMSKMVLSLDDRYLALGTLNCIVILDALTLQPLKSRQLGINLVTSMLFRRDGVLIFSTREARSDGPSGIEAWDWRTNNTLTTVYPPVEGQSRPTWELIQSADGERIAMLSRAFPATLAICDRDLHELGRLPLQVESASKEDTIGVALSPDGRRAVTVSRLNTNVELWDTVRFSLLLNLADTDGHTPAVGFTRFGQIIAGRWSGGVTIWDSGYPIPPTPR